MFTVPQTGTSICRVDTDEGSRYYIFSSTAEKFISHGMQMPEEAARWASDHETVFADLTVPFEEWLDNARSTNHVYDLRRATIHEMVRLVSELKLGHEPLPEEALALSMLRAFLDHTVEDFPPTHQALGSLEASYKDLGLHEETDELWLDRVRDLVHYVFEAAAFRLRVGTAVDDRLGPVPEASPNHRKIVGRYLSHLILIAKLAGEGKEHPFQIIDRYRER